jgi:hypothetical protein
MLKTCARAPYSGQLEMVEELDMLSVIASTSVAPSSFAWYLEPTPILHRIIVVVLKRLSGFVW